MKKKKKRSLPTLDQLRAKYLARVASTQREIRESSQLTAADLGLMVY